MLNGATIGAMEAFLSIRGARSLSLRMERAQQNASELAKRFEAHDQIARVRYPGLESHDTHAHAASFMDGFGAMMSIEVTGDGARASAVVEHTKLINNATSLGGIESTWERRSLIAGQEQIPATLIRFSVGCEDLEDIWHDIEAALAASAV